MAQVFSPPLRVCFVCLGNICRSPQAEGLFRHHVAAAGLSDRFVIDSAGTSAAHRGERPDRRTLAASASRGVTLTGTSRPFVAEDFDRFDWIIVMDRSNRRDVLRLARSAADGARVRLLREFDPAPDQPDVPDPYDGDAEGFQRVFDICDRSSAALLTALRDQAAG